MVGPMDIAHKLIREPHDTSWLTREDTLALANELVRVHEQNNKLRVVIEQIFTHCSGILQHIRILL